jgi:hypothetical protein
MVNGPTARATGQERVRRLIDLVEIRPLLAIHLDVDKELVHQRSDIAILERLVRHHVTPVTRRVTNRQQDRLALALRAVERLAAPWIPIDRIIRVLEKVRARLAREAVGHRTSAATRTRILPGRQRHLISSNAKRSKSTPRCSNRVRRKRRSVPPVVGTQNAAGIEGIRRHDKARPVIGRLGQEQRRHGRLIVRLRDRRRARGERPRYAEPQPQRNGKLAVLAASDTRHIARTIALAIADDHQLIHAPVIVRGVFAHQRRFAQFARSFPTLPRPLALGFFLATIEIAERIERRKVLRAPQKLQRIVVKARPPIR